MNNLITALLIFQKYHNDPHPTHCEHDILMLPKVTQEMSQDDIDKVSELGFFWSDEHDCWCSYTFGSC